MTEKVVCSNAAASAGASDTPHLERDALISSSPPACPGVPCLPPAGAAMRRAMRTLSSPLRSAQDAAERALGPDSLAAARLRSLKLLRRRSQGDTPFGASREVLLNAGLQRRAFCENATSSAKYNALTFLPRFLFEIFSRVAYLYFLVQAALGWWPQVSPFDPWGSTIALAFVLVVCATSELWQDAKRHRGDWVTNSRRTRVMAANGAFRDVAWRDVRVGDVVMVRDNEEVPADLVLLFAALTDRVCYVQTTNLDGETNLKVRSPVLLANTAAARLTPESASSAARLCGRVLCEPPSAQLHAFNARFEVWRPQPLVAGEEESAEADCVLTSVPVGLDDVLLRGCRLKNSQFVLGLAVFTGSETRIQLNTRRAPLKSGAYDQFLNVQITALIALQVILCVSLTVASWAWRRDHASSWYFQWQAHTGNNYESDGLYGVMLFLRFWVLLSYLVPISLFVSMVIVSEAQGALFINKDERMRDPVTGETALVRNTNLNEDLGMVSYLFSDKTGTLTSNNMRLRVLVLDGELYGETSFKLEACGLPPPTALRAFNARLADALLGTGNAQLQADALEALTAIAVCHTLIVDAVPVDAAPGEGEETSVGGARRTYTGPSPDEVALVDGVRLLGVKFTGRSSRGVRVEVFGDAAEYDVLAVLEFTSERQRMSVVVRRPDGRVTLFCKGADAAVIPLLAPACDARAAEVLSRTEAQLDQLAVKGLRTLLIASRDLPDEEWAALDALYQSASGVSNAQWQAQVALQLESGLSLLGATGVDDQLQEGVPETIRTLLAAGIKCWVITGDKQQTAITIGASSGLLSSPATVLILNATSGEGARERMAQLQPAFEAREGDGPELVVDGGTLVHVLSDAALARTFADLAASARAVICCRTSPRQKSAIVKLMKRHLHGKTSWWHPLIGQPDGRTLAIGDGANDVAMLQAADVGVGIAGKEGRQAFNNADVGLSQFRFLTRLLLVHGTLCRYRLARMIRYSFYKNICFAGLLFWFQFYCGFSGQALYDSISAGLYNVVLTSAPVVAFALLDRPLSDAGLLAHPAIYGKAQGLSGRTFWKALVDANVHSLICLLFSLYAVPVTGGPNGNSLSGLLAVGKLAFTAVLIVVTIEICLVSRYITAIFVVLVILSVALWFPLLWVIPLFADLNEMIGMAQLLYPSAVFWLTLALAGVASLTYRLAWRAALSLLWPTDTDILREQEVLALRKGGVAAERDVELQATSGQQRRIDE